MGVRAHACRRAHARCHARERPEEFKKYKRQSCTALLQKVSSDIRALRDLIGLEFRDT